MIGALSELLITRMFFAYSYKRYIGNYDLQLLKIKLSI